MMSLTSPSAYYSLASAHVGPVFTACVLKKEGDGEIVKDKELSWEKPGVRDYKASREQIDRLAETIMELGKKQTELQSHLPQGIRYSPDFLVSLHSTPEEVINDFLVQLNLQTGANTKEERGVHLIYGMLLKAIEAGIIEDFEFDLSSGQILRGGINGSDEIIALGKELQAFNEKAREGNELSMSALQLVAGTLILEDIKRQKELSGPMSFIKFDDPITEYLNLPEVVQFMKSVLKKNGLDPEKIDIKFPSDPRDDYYFNVVRPKMESKIKAHNATLQKLAKYEDLLRLIH